MEELRERRGDWSARWQLCERERLGCFRVTRRTRRDETEEEGRGSKGGGGEEKNQEAVWKGEEIMRKCSRRM
eukprot:143191-Hanusia_phi.AAC.3